MSNNSQYITYCGQTFINCELLAINFWERATENSLQLFGKQLKATTEAVETGSLFIEDEHYQQLHSVLQTFANYETGKGHLIELRQGDYIGDYELQQITENRMTLEEYSRLISEIRTSFREQLNVYVK